MPGIYAILSNHGFGHISRSAAILAEFQERRPDLELVVASTRPPELVRALLHPGFELRPVALDTGVASSDSLSFDAEATLRQIRQLNARAPDLVRSESRMITERGLDLVIGDIPPLAARVARVAGRPCWMWGNFGWDDIYRDWGGPLGDEADRAAELYSECDRLFRLPFHTPMSAFSNIADVGVTGRPTRVDPAATARRLGLDDRPLILLTFGGLGMDRAPFANAARLQDFQFVTFQHDAPELPNLRIVRGGDIQPKDLLPLCDRILSKPGYGTFSELLHNPLPFYCLEREGWAETPLLLDALRRFYSHRLVLPEEFFSDSWDFLREPVQAPSSPAPALDGNDVILGHLLNFFS